MDEIIYGLIVLLVRLFAWLFKLVFRFFRAVGGVVRRSRSLDGSETRTTPALGQTQSAAGTIRTAATAQPKLGAAGRQLAARAEQIANAAAAEARRCTGEEPNQRFCETLTTFVVPRARATRQTLLDQGDGAMGDANRAVQYLALVLRLVEALAAQRRDPDLGLLVGDSDALAAALYAPLIEHARAQGIVLAHDRIATLLSDEDLAALVGVVPTGLVPVVLPSGWATELVYWPALAHEVAHSFYRSVPLDGELRKRFGLSRGLGLPASGGLPRELALGAWLEELFADAFGVMMLGPAYLRTMTWVFASPDEPGRILTCPAAPGGGRLDEHPPRHLRVVLGCRLLDEMGHPAEARRLLVEWRARHRDPDRCFFPSRTAGWFAVDEDTLVEMAAPVVSALYREGFRAQGGRPLRSLPGLDYGPREHQAALAVAAELKAGRRSTDKSPRALIAGAVLAGRSDATDAAGARLLQLVRASIPALGISQRRLRLRAQASDYAPAVDGDVLDGDLVADAILLREILDRPRALRR